MKGSFTILRPALAAFETSAIWQVKYKDVHYLSQLNFGLSKVRIPAQVATRFRFIAPPDSDLSRHPIPTESAT
jgi:hypothetical protein